MGSQPVVLDTHVLVWDALAPERLSESAQNAIETGNLNNDILIADISLWEIAMLIEKKRLVVDVDNQAFLNLILQANNTVVQPITAEIASLSVKLPASISKDPADRLIAATALANNAALVTADKNLQRADQIKTIW